MCIICLEFQKHRDLADAWRMLQAARNEPKSIDPQHLDEVEKQLRESASEENKKPNG